MSTRVPIVFHAVLCLVTAPGMLRAETVSVQYGGDIDLAPFQCTDVPRGLRIRRVCYDGANRYLLVKHEETYRQFCEIEAGMTERLLASHSIDHYFESIIENRHGCRPGTMPKYP